MKNIVRRSALSVLALSVSCGWVMNSIASERDNEPAAASPVIADAEGAAIHPEKWPVLERKALDPKIEARIDEILARMTVEQKVGQTIQADSASVTPEEVKKYRLGSVLSGGNSAPGPLAYADSQTWLSAADGYWDASVDPEGVELAIPIIWGIDAVHGHANLLGATVFPHNIGLGAARDPELIKQIMQATAQEIIVSGHDWTFAPTLAVPRDDRWGRSYEGFSETPDIVVSYSDKIVEGLQGEYGTANFLANGRILSAAKHFIADGGTEGGRDQGDALISEEDLRDIHAVGYLPALAAEVQTVMVSFSSWQGIKMTGNKALITDVLKDRMGFNGFVISDWNAHGQIPGCSNTDCPQAFNAGIDMFMAPDSWKGLYESTLRHVRSGKISMERLDDAVRRILRVKLNYGLFDKARPSERPGAGNIDILGGEEHRALARRAVRQSLVLLKNQNQALPLQTKQKILVIGDAADNIAKASGGWTLSWQGGDHSNDEFPNGQSILAGIKEAVEAEGGEVIFDPQGTSGTKADVVIAVYGEEAYAEFQGDRDHLDFETKVFDTGRLSKYREQGAKVVSVFLSGRPMWTNPEINASDAFVAAWLPGSEGGGVADLLFQTKPEYDFTGRLSFSWPKTADQPKLNPDLPNYDPLFAYGYGLSYADKISVAKLSENSGLDKNAIGDPTVFLAGGKIQNPWSLYGIINGTQTRMNSLRWDGGGLAFSTTDRNAQEDSLKVEWRSGGPALRISTHNPVDFSRHSNADMALTFYARNMGEGSAKLSLGMECNGAGNCTAFVPVNVDGNGWKRYTVRLSCFTDKGLDLGRIRTGFSLQSDMPATIALSDVKISPGDAGTKSCGKDS